MPVQRGASEAITLDGSRYRIVPGSYKTDELEALATQIRSGLLSPADRANEFNASWFAIGARYVHKWNSGGATWDTDKDMGASSAAIKNCAAVFANTLVVGAGNSVDYWSRDTSGVWTQPSAGTKVQLFALVGNTLWRVFSANQLSSSTNGTTWTTAVSIGNSNQTATMLSDYNGNPHTGKPEGLFEYDGTTVRNRLAELGFRLNSENSRGGKPAR